MSEAKSGSVGSMTARLLLAALWVTACTDAKTIVDPDATGIEIVTQIDPARGVTQLRVSGIAAGGAPAFMLGARPDEPRALDGQQSVVVLLPETVDGLDIVVRVDGLAAGNVVATGGGRVALRARKVVRVEIALGPPVVCGDSKIGALVEGCDDGNTANGDGCSADCFIERGFVCTGPTAAPSTCKLDTFDVAGVASTGNREVTVRFSVPPDPTAATMLASYSVPGLTLSGTPLLNGSSVTLATSSQSAIGYNAIVTGVTRAADAKALTVAVGTFTGRTSFDVTNASSLNPAQITVTFGAPPNVAQATTLANYSVAGLTLSGTPTLVGATVTLATATQSTTTYTVTVTGVTRADDTEALTSASATFTGRNGFDVTSAASTSNREMTVTFNAPPNAVQATTRGNYSVSGLALVGTPLLQGNTVTLATASQQGGMPYTVMVSNVTRAGDGQTLGISSASFTGTPTGDPTVTDVQVLSTSPNNGMIPYNTGTIDVRLIGTQFQTVKCPSGVRLDDLDGVDGGVNTGAIACTVDSDTRITAQFPAGIRTNGTIGWNVIVTNMVSPNPNPTSAKLVVRAGLLVSEVLVEANSAPDHEFVELYNPTATPLDAQALGLRFHIRDKNGSDTNKALTVLQRNIQPHGFFLIVSLQSIPSEPWFAHRDATYTAIMPDLAAGGGTYISLSATANAKVIDKVGWGGQPGGGFEGAAMIDLSAGQSAERKPAGGAGHATDTDMNSPDFYLPSTAITPRGTADAAQP